MLKNYFADTGRALFTNGAGEEQRNDEADFVIQMSECLICLAQDTGEYKKAATYLGGALVPPAKIAEALRKDPHAFRTFLSQWQKIDIPSRSAVANALTDWSQKDSTGAVEFWAIALKKKNTSEIMKIITPVISSIAETPDNRAVWNAIVLMMPTELISQDILTRIFQANPKSLVGILKSWASLNDTTRLQVAETFMTWIQSDSIGANRFWKVALETSDLKTAFALTSPLIEQIGRSNDAIAVWEEFIKVLPVGSLTRDNIGVLTHLTSRLARQRWLLTALDSLTAACGSSTDTTKAHVLMYLESMLKRQVKIEHISRFTTFAKAFSDSIRNNRPLLVIGSISNSPAAGSAISIAEMKILRDEFERALTRDYTVEQGNLGITELSAQQIIDKIDEVRNLTFLQMSNRSANPKNNAAIILSGAYITTEKRIELYLALADAKDGAVFMTKQINLSRKNLLADAQHTAQGIVQTLRQQIQDAKNLEEYLNVPISGNPAMLRAVLDYGFTFGAEQEPGIDTIGLNRPFGIALYEPFLGSEKFLLKDLERLREMLKKVIAEYPTPTDIEGNMSMSDSLKIYIHGRAFSSDSLLFFFTRPKTNATNDTLSRIFFKLSQKTQELTDLQRQGIVNVIRSNLNAIIPRRIIDTITVIDTISIIDTIVDTIYIKGIDHIPPLSTALSSLVLAGIPQINLVKKLDIKKPLLNAEGVILSVLQIAGFATAIIGTTTGYTQGNWNALKIGQIGMYTVAGTGVISGVTVYIAAARHNKNIEQKH